MLKERKKTNMTDKQYRAYKYLSRLWRIKREIQDKEDELKSIGLASGIRYDRINVQITPSDPMERVSDLIGEIQQEKETYLRMQHKMINEIHGLEDHVCEHLLYLPNKQILLPNLSYLSLA